MRLVVVDGRRRWLFVILYGARAAGLDVGLEGISLVGVQPDHLVVVEEAHDRQQSDGHGTQQTHLLKRNAHRR